MTSITDIIARIEDAQRAWTGLDWDDSLRDGIIGADGKPSKDAALRHLRERGTACWLPDDGSFASQTFRRRLQHQVDLAQEGADIDLDDLVSLADEEATYVDGRAASARRDGDNAIERLRAGDLKNALELLESASMTERAFGDDPAWGTPLRLLRDLIDQIEDDR